MAALRSRRPIPFAGILPVRILKDLGSESEPTRAGVPEHLGAIGAKRRSDGQVVVDWSLESIPFFLRIDGPLSQRT